jgi:hypothetical protein
MILLAVISCAVHTKSWLMTMVYLQFCPYGTTNSNISFNVTRLLSLWDKYISNEEYYLPGFCRYGTKILNRQIFFLNGQIFFQTFISGQ